MAALQNTEGTPSVDESTTSDKESSETQSESGEEDASSVSEPDEPEHENAGDSSPSGDTVLRTVKPRYHVSTAELDQQIAELREERSQFGIGFPITMLAVGGATFVVGTALYVVSQTECEAPCELGDGDGFLWMGFLGAGAALWGGVTLGSRLGPRRELGRQIKALEAEKREIQGEVSIAPVIGPTTTGLRLNVTF